MECKFQNRVGYMSHTSELIDTLWNVNYIVCSFKDSLNFELIDTLWNVNYYGGSWRLPNQFRINRYIMECKFRHNIATQGNLGFELIDTLWNVNLF